MLTQSLSSKIRELENKIAQFERLRDTSSQGSLRHADLERGLTACEDLEMEMALFTAFHGLSTNKLLPQTLITMYRRRHHHEEQYSQKVSKRQVCVLPQLIVLAMVPPSNLSSSDNFGSEVRSFLAAKSTPNSTTSPEHTTFDAVTLDRKALLNIPDFPTESESSDVLEIVVFNVGISQQLVDIRSFSDNVALLYDDSKTITGIPSLWLVEVLLVFAIGRLLQAKIATASDLPGLALFQEAMRRQPRQEELRRQGILGVEVTALTALYLQIIDRKEDAYIYVSILLQLLEYSTHISQSNSSLRLAICHGMHREISPSELKRSERMHRNRLWWSVYMQEK